jgi:hypothetical protein
VFDECRGNVLFYESAVSSHRSMQILRDAIGPALEDLLVLVCLKNPVSEPKGSISQAHDTSSISSRASSTFSGRMLELAFKRSIFLRFEMVVFTACWYSSRTDVRC